jgi:integrase
MATGVYKRHAKACRTRTTTNGRCNCEPSFQAQVFDKSTGKLVTKTLPTAAAARTWRHEVLTAVRTGRQARKAGPTIAAALEELLERMESGAQLDRSGKTYKPATIRSYRQGARDYLIPHLGRVRLDALRRGDVQRFVDDLRAQGLKPPTVHCKLDPLRVVYRLAIRDELVMHDPLAGVDLPRRRGRRDRIASPDHAEALLDALPDDERAAWATAFYAGLRVGELRALRWGNVDFEKGVIRVEQSWDDEVGEIDVKTYAGRRAVPLIGRLRSELLRHKLASGRGPDDLAFGRTPVDAFTRTTMRSRAIRAWADAGLKGLTPHEGRHTCASYLIAAGLNMKQIQTYIGHSDVRTTYNVYGHLLPGDEHQAVTQLDAFLGGMTRPVEVGAR